MALIRPPRDLSDELLGDKCRDFTEFQVWPLKVRLNPEGWLSNFQPTELLYGKHLLNAFMYFSESLTKQLFTTAVQNISMLIAGSLPVGASLPDEWQTFLRNSLFTYVTGEVPSPADSGYLFARMARDTIPIDEAQIITVEDAIRRAHSGSAQSIIFVDDFVGSGNQFCETWERPYDVGSGYVSFRDLELAGRMPTVYYCPPVCTEYGLNQIAARCPSVIVSAGNVLGERYSVFHPDSVVWPEELRTSGPDFVRDKSQSLGIPSDGGVWDYRGFHDLGLCLGFAHKIPDATIPLFRWAKPGWQPLVSEG